MTGIHSATAQLCVPSFRRAFAPFHSFTVLVLTSGFKRASPSRIKGPGDLGFKERVMLRGHRACFDSWPLRTRYAIRVACSFRFIALRTRYGRGG